MPEHKAEKVFLLFLFCNLSKKQKRELKNENNLARSQEFTSRTAENLPKYGNSDLNFLDFTFLFRDPGHHEFFPPTQPPH